MGPHRVFRFYHYFGNLLLNLIANVLYDTNLSDLMTCYKAFKSNVLKRLKLRANGFGIEAEFTAQILNRRLRVYEVPISYDGRDYDEGKKITWKDFLPSLYWLLKCKFDIFDAGEDALYKGRIMKNNNNWVYEQIKPYLGENVLEVGSGIGNISKSLVSYKRNLLLTDINEIYLQYLKFRFIGNPKVKVIAHDILSGNYANILSFKIDTVVCVNVLEHIKDDQRALSNIYGILEKGGLLILLVPALKVLQGTLDERLLHFRRYEKKELTAKLETCNFNVEKIYYLDLAAAFGWLLNGKILKRHVMPIFQVKAFDKIIPCLARLEKMIKIPFGLSLVAICRKE